jgi:glycosyltransferase involved in cell wall biosynthesis
MIVSPICDRRESLVSSDRLHLLVITQNFPQREREWAGQFVLRQARFLRALGIDTTFIVPRPWTPWPLHRLARWRQYGPENPLLDVPDFNVCPVLFLRPPGAGIIRYEGAMMKGPVMRAAKRLNNSVPFDLVLGVQMNGEAISAVEVGQRLGMPTAALGIGTDVMVLPEQVPGLRNIQARTLERLDLPLAVSKEIARRLEATSLSCRRPYVVRLARDVGEFRPADDREAVRREHGVAPEDIVAIYVGRVDAAKGMEDMLAVLPSLIASNPRLRFVFLGDGPCRSRLVEAGERVRAGSVAAPGRVASSQIAGHLQSADLFVFPSHSEGLPQAVLEAMNCGLPVVATDVGGTAEAVKDGVTGLLVPARDRERLAKAVSALAGNGMLRRRFGTAALEHVKREFDPIEHSERLAARLRELVASRRR